jgi:ATP-binding cassette subfamily B (MDR/TAP) protein 1
LHEIDLEYWRSQIGLVQQEPALFNDTIQKNLEYGLVGTEWEFEPAHIKKRLVRQACKEAFADEFIDRLPQGYNTIVGDAGIKLSGGQRQRLSIARSIVKKPSILILDEATSAIDVRSERIVQKALDAVSRGRTTITIAHRLSTIMKADNIVVLQKGQVVEQGTHQQLLSSEVGLYRSLVEAQQLTLSSAHLASPHSTEVFHEKEEMFSPIEQRFDSIDLEGGARLRVITPTSALGSFQLFMWEQRHQRLWYLVMIAGSIGAGGTSFSLNRRLHAYKI